jgi:hypothetical protein
VVTILIAVVAVWSFSLGVVVTMLVLAPLYGRKVKEEAKPDLTFLFVQRLEQENRDRKQKGEDWQEEKTPGV